MEYHLRFWKNFEKVAEKNMALIPQLGSITSKYLK